MFAAPVWLAGLLALALPLALHLWSRRPRTVIRVGSLRHLEGLPEARTWSTRLSEPLLLAVRLLLLLVVVLALAGPLVPPATPVALTRLVLLDPGIARAPDAAALLDSIRRSGTPIRLIAPGLPDLEAGPRPGPPVRLWDALAAADRLARRGGTIDVIARPAVTTLGGSRPALRARVVWHVPPRPGERRWIARAWRTPHDSVALLLGAGDADQVVYRRATLPHRSGGAMVRLGESGPVWAGPEWTPGDVPVEVPPTHRVALDAGGDSILTRRLALAVRAVAMEQEQAVVIQGSDTAADLLVTTGPEQPAGAARVLEISPAVATGGTVADSVWRGWPWPALRTDPADPRSVDLAQALPDTAGTTHVPMPEPATEPLLWLAGGLLILERWLATRPERSAA